MKVAFDTNVLLYAISGGDARRRDIAAGLLTRIRPGDQCLACQVAGEFYTVATRKLKRPADDVQRYLQIWSETIGFQTQDQSDMLEATAFAARHKLQIWDALILHIAAREGCALFLSEDMQDGFVYRGVTVANPFAETPHPLLASLLESLPGPDL